MSDGSGSSPADTALDRMRAGLAALATLNTTRGTTRSITRDSIRGRRERHRLRRLDARLDGIDELYAAVLLITAATSRIGSESTMDPRPASAAIADLARAVGTLADRPTDPDAYRHAHDLATSAAAELDEPLDADPTRDFASGLRLAVRQVATFTAPAAANG